MTAARSYYTQDKEKGIQKKIDGFIPKNAGDIMVEVYLTRRGEREDLWDELKNSSYSRRDRQNLQKAMSNVEKHIGPISELYSPPRISAAAEKKGLEAGTCFDLQTGWDRSQEFDRKQMWKVLREERPEVIAVCPPCGPFSQMQAIDKGRGDPAKAMRILYAGQEHLRLAVAVCIWQLNQGASCSSTRRGQHHGKSQSCKNSAPTSGSNKSSATCASSA